VRRLARPICSNVWAWLIALLCVAAPAAASPFSDWAAVVVAGDWHAHSGAPSEAFDNARRDVTQAFEQAGFDAANLRQFSVRPELYKGVALTKSNPDAIAQGLSEVTAQAQGGCLVYFSSHGAPMGVVIDQGFLSPGTLAGILDNTCGKRPTVVIISACFSGVFVQPLARSNRMVLTAARPDRTSFGCGESDKYPYFDQCVLESMPKASDFANLATTVQACVAAREIKEGMKPPSEPQLFIGPALKPMLPLYAFDPPKRN
jgi:hypothetical protein